MLGDDYYPLNIVNGLASAQITDIIHEVNRVEIRWILVSNDVSQTDIPRLLEHFAAWLEISEAPAPTS